MMAKYRSDHTVAALLGFVGFEHPFGVPPCTAAPQADVLLPSFFARRPHEGCPYWRIFTGLRGGFESQMDSLDS